jgi:hypothetical protein
MHKSSTLVIIFLGGSTCSFPAVAGTSSVEQFLGQWMVVGSNEESVTYEQCKRSEGVVITPKQITWTTEGGCQINGVKASQWGTHNDISVSMTCFHEEGRTTPLKVKQMEIWSLFEIQNESYMTQTNPSTVETSIFKKCK